MCKLSAVSGAQVGTGLALLLLFSYQVAAQDKAKEPPTMSMSSDRAANSYAIYSKLLPLGETAGARWPHEMFLVQDVTISVVPADHPCRPDPHAGPDSGNFDAGMNPHIAVRPPTANVQDFKEILEDFDAHCHDRVRLETTGWKTSAPVRLMAPAEQKEFQVSRDRRDVGGKFAGAAALYGFSEVYFNAHRTVALVYATHWCGNLCGQGFWVAFGLQEGEWKPVRWQSNSWVS